MMDSWTGSACRQPVGIGAVERSLRAGQQVAGPGIAGPGADEGRLGRRPRTPTTPPAEVVEEARWWSSSGRAGRTR